ncbi:hypothetical protein JM47_01000 [Ureaplasma diversum]|uniref:Uncharacterized protein n=1 Tax=Ureaplasma diversum TaxID=42094 RepID=A0A0C5RP09_9BACT|nr:DUF5452 domain-containing protein [Ureaplasma diversum]AJQ45214.1 hypothetical protein JM47_01000 [Ureaplasma diversum]
MKKRLKSALVACFCLIIIGVATALGIVFNLKPKQNQDPKKQENLSDENDDKKSLNQDKNQQPKIIKEEQPKDEIKQDKEQELKPQPEEKIEPPVYINVPVKTIEPKQKQAEKQIIKEQAPTPKNPKTEVFNPHVIKEDVIKVQKDSNQLVNKDITHINQKPTIKQLLYNQDDLAAGIDLVVEVNTKQPINSQSYLELIDDKNMLYKSLLQKPETKTNKLIYEFKNLSKKRAYRVYSIKVYNETTEQFISQKLETADTKQIDLKQTKVINLQTEQTQPKQPTIKQPPTKSDLQVDHSTTKIENKQESDKQTTIVNQLPKQQQQQQQPESTQNQNQSDNQAKLENTQPNNDQEIKSSEPKTISSETHKSFDPSKQPTSTKPKNHQTSTHKQTKPKSTPTNNEPTINPFDKQNDETKEKEQKQEVEVIKTIPIKRFNLVNSLNNNPVFYQLINWSKYFNSYDAAINFDEDKFKSQIESIMRSAILSYPEFKHLSKHLRVNIKYKLSQDLKSIIIIINWYLDNYNLENEQRFYDEIVIELGS